MRLRKAKKNRTYTYWTRERARKPKPMLYRICVETDKAYYLYCDSETDEIIHPSHPWAESYEMNREANNMRARHRPTMIAVTLEQAQQLYPQNIRYIT